MRNYIMAVSATLGEDADGEKAPNDNINNENCAVQSLLSCNVGKGLVMCDSKLSLKNILMSCENGGRPPVSIPCCSKDLSIASLLVMAYATSGG